MTLAKDIYERLILNGAKLGSITIDIIQDELDEHSEWIPAYPEQPIDEQMYDIKLNDGSVVENVEFWAFGGGWKPTKRNEGTNKLVHYEYRDVCAFRRVK